MRTDFSRGPNPAITSDRASAMGQDEWDRMKRAVPDAAWRLTPIDPATALRNKSLPAVSTSNTCSGRERRALCSTLRASRLRLASHQAWHLSRSDAPHAAGTSLADILTLNYGSARRRRWQRRICVSVRRSTSASLRGHQHGHAEDDRALILVRDVSQVPLRVDKEAERLAGETPHDADLKTQRQ